MWIKLTSKDNGMPVMVNIGIIEAYSKAQEHDGTVLEVHEVQYEVIESMSQVEQLIIAKQSWT